MADGIKALTSWLSAVAAIFLISGAQGVDALVLEAGFDQVGEAVDIEDD